MAIGPQTKIVDLEGKFVTPGLIDSHVHFISGGLQVCMRSALHYLNVVRCDDLFCLSFIMARVERV